MKIKWDEMGLKEYGHWAEETALRFLQTLFRCQRRKLLLFLQIAEKQGINNIIDTLELKCPSMDEMLTEIARQIEVAVALEEAQKKGWLERVAIVPKG